MATVATDIVTIHNPVKGGVIERSWTFASDIANSGDDISLFVVPAGWRVKDCWYNGTSTFGATITLQLRLGTAALCAASSATGVSANRMNVAPPAVSASAATVNLLLAAADTTAAGVCTIWMVLDKF